MKNFGKSKVFQSFKDSIWGSDLAFIQSIRKFNRISIFIMRC